VVEYRDMATIVRDRVQDMIKAGKTLDQIKAAKPTLEYDGLYSTPAYTGNMFIDAVYQDLSRAARPPDAPKAPPAASPELRPQCPVSAGPRAVVRSVPLRPDPRQRT
jgi:hypothetical protein